MVVAIAGMLVALPYESNAVVGAVVAGAIVAGIIFALGYYIGQHASSNTPAYTTNYEAYRENWNATITDFGNMFRTWQTEFSNTLSLMNATSLYWQRLAEHEAVKYVNYSTWNSSIEEQILNDIGFYEWANNYTAGFLHHLGLIFRDIVYEIKGITATEDGLVSTRVNYGTSWYVLLSGDKKVDVDARLVFGGDASVFPPSLDNYVEYEDLGNGVKIYIYNTTEKLYELANDQNVACYVKFYNDSHGSYKAWFSGLFGGKLYYGYNWDGTGWGPNTDANEKYNRTKIVVNGISTLEFGWIRKEITDYFAQLYGIMNTIRTNALQSAQLTWDTYRNVYGYTNYSDIPADKLPVFPDFYLNFDALKNLSFDDMRALWYSILAQLNDETIFDKTNVTDEDLRITDYKGKIANITLMHVINDTAHEVIFDRHRCYLFAYKDDVTLNVNEIYVITTNLTDADLWRNAFNKTVNVKTIPQTIMLYDTETGRAYYITPSSNNYGYGFYVNGLLLDNKSVNSLTYNVMSVGNYTYLTWGFYLTPHSANLPFIPSTSQSWFDEYKGLITVACLVLGIVFTASSRKGSGAHTIGVLLFVAGIALAFYFYILPAWNGFTEALSKLNPANWW